MDAIKQESEKVSKEMSDSAELWKMLMEDPKLGNVVTKWLNDEPFDLASPVLDALNNDASSLESTVDSASD